MGDSVVIGVDGGSTKTEAVVVDAAARVRGRGMAPPSNPNSVGLERAFQALQQAIQRALSAAEARWEEVLAICLCLSGVDRPDERARIAERVRRLHPIPRVSVYNDAVGALAAGTGRLLGVVVIAGTGTIAYGVNREGRAARAAGWGALLADYGGGFWIGIEALQAIVCAADGRGPPTALADRVLAHLGLRAPSDLIAWTYDRPLHWDRFAALVPVVVQVARANDPVARDILRRAGRHLADSALAVIRRLDMEDEAFELVLAGSVWQAGELIQAPMRETVRRSAPRVRFVRPTRRPAEGAALLAWEEVRRGAHGDDSMDHRGPEPGLHGPGSTG